MDTYWQTTLWFYGTAKVVTEIYNRNLIDMVLLLHTDASHLRMVHRITGSLIGSLPTQPKQNNEFGLPLVLQPEETTLLIEQGMRPVTMVTVAMATVTFVKMYYS